MRLPFLDRENELGRIRKRLSGAEPSFVCVYGRRRIGKTRLIREAVGKLAVASYVGDERDESLQRAALARVVDSVLPDFSSVDYPDWESLLNRWKSDAPAGAVLVIDEFQSVVGASPSFPSVLQKILDAPDRRQHVVICGSSQRKMSGVVLDRSSALYGRAQEILKLSPLHLRWLEKAIGTRDPSKLLGHYAVWGGVPRYWELAKDYASLDEAILECVLSPLGVLHQEPDRLLRDDMTQTRQAASILVLIGRGCHRLSEIAARMEKPATSLSRPLQTLLELGLVRRETPFGQSRKTSKRSLYQIEDPFLRFWATLVDPHRSRLQSGLAREVWKASKHKWQQHQAAVWEHLCRQCVVDTNLFGKTWSPGARWWGLDAERNNVEIDLVSQAIDDPDHLLAAEIKLRSTPAQSRRSLDDLVRKVTRLPFARKKKVETCLFALQPAGRQPAGVFGMEHLR